MKINAKTAYRFAKFAKEQTRPILSTILIEKNRMVATDTYKLLIIESKEKNDVGEKGQLLNLPEFIKTFKAVDKDVEIETIENKTAGFGNYPNIDQIIPTKDFNVEIEFDAKLLIEALEPFKSKQSNDRVTLKVTKNKPLVLSAEQGTDKVTAIVMPLKS